MERYRVPICTSEADLIVKGSRFIGSLAPASDSDAAQAFLAEVRQRYSDATHHAWAYRMPSTPQETIAFSDDGEPGGTAGRPMLTTLAGNDLYESVIVGTRYFGGVKLGTGGLVRAYSAAASAAIERACLGTKVLHTIVEICIPYSQYGAVRYELEQHGAQVIDAAFTQNVNIRLAIPQNAMASVDRQLRDISSGAITVQDRAVTTRYLLQPD